MVYKWIPSTMEINELDNDNGMTMETSIELNKGALHLNSRDLGLGKLAINFITRIKKFATT